MRVLALALGTAFVVSLPSAASGQQQAPIEEQQQQQPGVTIVPAPLATTPPAHPTSSQAPVAATTPTRTYEPILSDAPPARRVHRSYALQTMIVDGVIFATGAVGFGVGEPTLSTVGLVGYLIGSPIIHMAHGHAGKSFGDFGLRVAFPLVGLGIGGLVGLAVPKKTSAAQSAHIEASLAIGAVAGALGAMAFDALILAEDTVVETQEEARARPPVPRFRMVPQLGFDDRSASFGVAGTF